MDIESSNRNRMVAFIKEHYGDVLGEHVALLDSPGGLDQLSRMAMAGRFGMTPKDTLTEPHGDRAYSEPPLGSAWGLTSHETKSSKLRRSKKHLSLLTFA